VGRGTHGARGLTEYLFRSGGTRAGRQLRALAVIALLFGFGMLGLSALTGGFTVIFFVASAAASAAYLTVSELCHAGDQSARHRDLLCGRHPHRRGRRTHVARL
jgi:hypothetical protein